MLRNQLYLILKRHKVLHSVFMGVPYVIFIFCLWLGEQFKQYDDTISINRFTDTFWPLTTQWYYYLANNGWIDILVGVAFLWMLFFPTKYSIPLALTYITFRLLEQKLFYESGRNFGEHGVFIKTGIVDAVWGIRHFLDIRFGENFTAEVIKRPYVIIKRLFLRLKQRKKK